MRSQEGKLVDSECFKLTASFVRDRHRANSSIPVCQFYEVIQLLIYNCNLTTNRLVILLLMYYKMYLLLIHCCTHSLLVYLYYIIQEFDAVGRREPIPAGVYDMVK